MPNASATMHPLVKAPSAETANQAEPARPLGPELDRPGPRRLLAVMELTKPRITRLVTMTSLVGFVLSIRARSGWTNADLAVSVLGCIAGTWLSSAGANALNQWYERIRDARMRRTAGRPLPSLRLSPAAALAAGVFLSLAGVGLLCILCGPAASLVSLATILVYVCLYTPAKPLTPFSTLIGAIPGALPPLIGWTAAAAVAAPLAASRDAWAGLFEPGGWTLFALMAVWQLPHFLALAWMYQDDYAAAGHRMLPLYDRTGRLTAGAILFFTILLIPATLAPAIWMPDRLGWPYIAIASATGLLFLASSIRLALAMNAVNARRVFLGSVMHLPILLLAMVGEVVVRALL